MLRISSIFSSYGANMLINSDALLGELVERGTSPLVVSEMTSSKILFMSVSMDFPGVKDSCKNDKPIANLLVNYTRFLMLQYWGLERLSLENYWLW